MRKRERENPCGVCGHYHKYEEGEVCPVCGHRPAASLERPIQQSSAFPSEILKDFLYLGSYDNASRVELLKTLGISRILNTVPACQNLYKNSFTYHCLQDEKSLPFADAIQFIEQCEKDQARILVHCMSGKIRSPAIVIAYLMKCKGWRLAQSFQWVKDRRPEVDLSSAFHQQLVEFEQKVFGSNGPNQLSAFPSSEMVPSFGFRFSKQTTTAPTFSQPMSASIFDRRNPNEFVFGAEKNNELTIAASNSFGITPPAGNEAPMDGL